MLYIYNMSTEDQNDRLFKALGHRLRRQILDLLKAEPRTTGALCAAFPEVDRCTVMQHLGVLEEAGLLVAQRVGRERWNHLNVLPIWDIHERWIGAYAAYAADRLGKLKLGLEV